MLQLKNIKFDINCKLHFVNSIARVAFRFRVSITDITLLISLNEFVCHQVK